MKIILTSDLHYGFNEKNHEILSIFFKKIKIEHPDLVIIAGDLISNSQAQLEQLCNLMDKELPFTTIAVVKGNHDMWDTNVSFSLDDRIRTFKETLKNHNIIYLPEQPLTKDNINVLGFDGWYSKDPAGITNDDLMMPITTNNYLTFKYMKDLEKVQIKRVLSEFQHHKTNILVTHFGFNGFPFSNSESYNTVFNQFNYILYGHSHRDNNYTFNNTQYINSGSDYNNPKMTTIMV